MTTAASPFAADLTTWAIVVTAAGYEAQQVPMNRIGAPDIIAIHPGQDSADKALERVKMMADIARPQWEASIAHEVALRNKIIGAIHAVALPRPEEDAPGQGV